MNDETQTEKRGVVVKGYKEFTLEEITAARKAKKKAFALEMEIYNARAIRGDFDSY